MGLLDDLKKQAESRQQSPLSHEERLRTHGYFDAVQNALTGVSRYFSELAQSLNVIKPDVQRQFYIEGDTRLSELRQRDYTVRDRRKTVESRDYLTEISLMFTCEGAQHLTFERDTPRAIDNMKEYFWGYSLPFECREVRNERGKIERAVFMLLPKVPSTISLAGNWDTGAFKLTLRNIEVLGAIEQSLQVGDINHHLLEEIGKFVLNQPNVLRDIGQHNQPQPMSVLPPVERKDPEYPSAPEPEPSAADTKPGGIVGALKSILKR